jgi:hypothetical protein
VDDEAVESTNRTMLRFALVVGAVALGAVALRAIAKAPAPVYRYVNHWRVLGPIDEVAAVLRDATSYPRWWPSVYLAVEPFTDETGVERRRVRSQGFLPYAIDFVAHVVDERLPHAFSVVAEGQMQGRGDWQLEADGDWVDITYRWQVSANKMLWRTTSWALRPLFEANHDWAMRRGEESLRLELARRRARSDAERDAVPPPPPPVRGRLDAVDALVDVFRGNRAEPRERTVSP